MDFRFSDEDEALRREIDQFLRDTLPAGWAGTGSDLGDEDWEFAQEFNRKLAAKRWIAPSWPRAYGGLDASHIEQLIFSEALSYHRAPPGQRVFGTGMIGPTLIVHGSEEQRRQHLPGITSGTVAWCQGYSEPGAGSDLASLQTRAERDGDDYIINGQKIWTTGAHHSDWIFVLARTDANLPKHKGISFFLVEMQTPGISVQPLVNMVDRHEFNQVFFEDVRVPKANMVGPENGGWYVAMTLLDFERSSIGSVASARRSLEEVVAYLRAPRPGGSRLTDEPLLRTALAELAIENEVARVMAYRIASMQDRGLTPNHEASMIKVFATELLQRLYNFEVNALGLHGQLRPCSPNAPLGGRAEQGYLTNVAPTIYSGSNEIQRNIIATRGLGLPR